MILTYVCFLPGSLEGQRLADLVVNSGIDFQPGSAEVDGRRVRLGSIADLEAALDPADPNLTIHGDEIVLSTAGLGGMPGQVIIIESERHTPFGVLERAKRAPGFTTALVGDGDDVFWQSTEHLSTYELYGRDTVSLPTVWDEVFQRPKIDVSRNPGRRVSIPGMWLWPTAQMWFGPPAFSIVDRDRLISTPVGKVRSFADGTVHVALFDLGTPIDEVRQLQSSFRSWMAFDALEKDAHNLALRYEDPRVEVRESGRNRSVVEWLDDGRLVPRSRARLQRTTVLDPSGQVLSTGTEEAG